MILLGITGAIGHGKTSFADAIQAVEPLTVHFESGLIITEVVDAMHAQLEAIPSEHDLLAISAWLACLPDLLQEHVHRNVTFDDIAIRPEDVAAYPLEYKKLFEHIKTLQGTPGLSKQAITAENKHVFRPMLQWVGGYVVSRTDGSVWFDEVIRRAKQAGEAGTVVSVAGGLRFPEEADSIRKAGGSVVKVYRPNASEKDITDPTERRRESIVHDVLVINDGTLADLADKANQLLADLTQSKLASRY